MSGISKCNGDNCEVKEQCYRYTCRVHSHWQSWIEAPSMRPCEMMIQNCLWQKRYVSRDELEKMYPIDDVE